MNSASLHPHPTDDMAVAEIMETWPDATPVFLHRRMACPGCAMAPFMTLREAAESYGLDAEALLADLIAAIDGAPPPGPFQPALPHRTDVAG
jgi:hybrid cluster-associated redox disulfide protein